jgi:hypothetical protein
MVEPSTNFRWARPFCDWLAGVELNSLQQGIQTVSFFLRDGTKEKVLGKQRL